MFSIVPMTAGSNPAVQGSGTLGRLTKWTGFSGSTSSIGDSSIFEDKFGKVGISTDTPTSKLTVMGLIESRGAAGGVKFPDGTVQTSAGIAMNQAVTTLNGLKGNVTLAPGANITITPSGNTLTIAAPNSLTVLEPVQLQLRQFSGEESFTVPSGKQLVIEHISGFLDTLNFGERTGLPLSTTVSGSQLFHIMVLEFAHAGSVGRVYFIDKPVRFYADPGTVVSVLPGSADELRLVLSGRYVAVP